MKIILFGATFFIIWFSAYSHPPETTPTAIVRSGFSDVGHGGYGYLYQNSPDITSEASASALMSFDCRDRDKREQVALYCGVSLDTLPNADGLVNDTMKGIILDRLRKQAVEFYAANLKAATAGTSSPFDVRTLTATNPDLAGCNFSNDDPILLGLQGPSTPEGRRFDRRVDAVQATVSPMNMARAMLTREWFQSSLGTRRRQASSESDHNAIPATQRGVTRHQFYNDIGFTGSSDTDHSDDYNCGATGLREEERQRLEGQCVALQAQIHRLETNFPALYTMSTQARGSVRPEATVLENPNLFDHQEMVVVTGADGEPSPQTQFVPGMMTAIRDLIVANGGSYQTLIQALRSSGTDNFIALEDALTAAHNNAQSASASPALTQALAAFNQAGARINERHANTMRSKIRDLCSRRVSGSTDLEREIFRIGLFHPNVIRQSLIDMTPQMRGLAKAVLCEANIANRLTPENQCQGVTGGPIPGTQPVAVNRMHMADFPFSSNQYMSISQASDTSPRVVNLNLNVQVGPNVDVSDPATMAAIQSQVAGWQSDVSSYSNCQVGAPGNPATYTDSQGNTFNCPPEAGMQRPPGVQFNLNFTVVPASGTPAPPTIKLHDCFRAEMDTGSTAGSASNCQSVQQWHVNECVRTGGVLATCQANAPAVGSVGFNRANASNLTRGAAIGTVRHEVLHLMGLNDEYQDRAYTFNEIGEHNSIMNNSNSPTSRLYPRHVDQILSPLRCPGRIQ